MPHATEMEMETKSIANDAGTTQDTYDDTLDTIIGWSINRTESLVHFETRRSTDDITRRVPEEVVQRANESKVLEYWKSLGKSREDTIKCSTYRIFDILDHHQGKPPQVLIHWVGYSADPKAGSTSWEPVSKMLASLDGPMVREYLDREGLTTLLSTRKRAPSSKGPSDRPADEAVRTPASKKRRRSTPAAALSKRSQRSGALGAGARAEPAAVNGLDATGDAKPATTKSTLRARETMTVENKPPRAATARTRTLAAAPAKATPSAARAAGRRARYSSTSAKVAGGSQDGLFQVELSISGIPHQDVGKLLELAAALSAQPNAVSISNRVTPL